MCFIRFKEKPDFTSIYNSVNVLLNFKNPLGLNVVKRIFMAKKNTSSHKSKTNTKPKAHKTTAKKKKKQFNIKRFLLKIFLSATIFLLFLGGVFYWLVNAGAFGLLPTEDNLLSIKNEEASLVYSADDKLIGKFFAEDRTNISYNELPKHLINALVATEDKRYFEHEGFDTRSYLRVLIKTLILKDRSGGGGSTITQQVIKNLYGRRNFSFLTMPVNKLKEAIIATRLEKVYTKEDILLLYFNSVPFGEDVYGIEAAAHRYFNKPTQNLRIEEAAVLIGMLKANTYYNPRINPENSRERRNVVFSLMYNEKYISKVQLEKLKALPLELDYENFNVKSPAGYFVYQVKKKANTILEDIKEQTGKEYDLEKDGLTIRTTLNMQLQNFALNSTEKHLKIMQKKLDDQLYRRRFKKQWLKNIKSNKKYASLSTDEHRVNLFDWDNKNTQYISSIDSLWHYYKMLNAAVLITDPNNGQILSWIGGNSYRFLPFDMILSHRQIASTFKPILYTTALENDFSPTTRLENTVKTYKKYNNWKPENFDHKQTPDSTVAFWYALANSMNVPTVDLYFKVGRSNLVSMCNKLGFPPIKRDLPSMAIGTLDLSLHEIVRAYSALANDGILPDYYIIDQILDANNKVIYQHRPKPVERVISKKTTEDITAILQTAVNEGTGTRIRWQFKVESDVAGKTGTATNYSNAWFMAYTPNLVIGTWVGCRTPDVHFTNGLGTGSALALPVAGQVLADIENNFQLRRKYLQPFDLPESTYDLLASAPFLEKGSEKTFFEKFFDKKKKGEEKTDKKESTEEKEEKEEKAGKLKSIMRKLFGKNKD